MSISALLRPNTNTDLLLQQIQTDPKEVASGKAEKIRKYAGEFEANLLASLYKDMQHSLGDVPDQDDPGGDTLTDMGIHALATGISAAGGIGIANLLIQHLVSKETAAGSGK